MNRIGKIVSGLKRFSRSQENQPHANQSLAKIVQDIMFLVESKAKRSQVEIEVLCMSDGFILCDDVEMEQVVVNLVNNAIEAASELDEKWVKIELIESSESVFLMVMDSGRGIPDEIKQKMFDPFFTTKSVGQGTGLGLSIVKGILDDHKSTIELKLKDGRTCFEVCVPKSNVRPPQDDGSF